MKISFLTVDRAAAERDAMRQLEGGMAEEMAFLRSLKDGPASLLDDVAKIRLLHLGKDPEFRRAYCVVEGVAQQVLLGDRTGRGQWVGGEWVPNVGPVGQGEDANSFKTSREEAEMVLRDLMDSWK